MSRFFSAMALLLASCAQESPVDLQAWYRAEGDRLEELARHKRVAYTFEDFIAAPDYRSTRDMWRGSALEQYAPEKSHVEFLLTEQRGRLYIDGSIAMDFPICSGRVGGSETPKGKFRVTQKIREHRSNRYGSFMSSDGSSVLQRRICHHRELCSRGRICRTGCGSTAPSACMWAKCGAIPIRTAACACRRRPLPFCLRSWKLGQE